MKRLSIGRDGIGASLQALLPKVREAGKLAAALQPKIGGVSAPDQKDADHVARAALTHADLLLEDRLGSDMLTLLDDASFFGEERDHDHISRFIPEGRPYTVTLDPINGTMQYRHGLPHYETIVTICDREWAMLGAIVYRPAFDDAHVAWKQGADSSARYHRWNDDEVEVRDIDLTKGVASRKLHLDISWLPRENALREAGYEFIDIWSDYAGQRDWPYSQADVPLGNCCAMAWKSPWSLLIDAAAFGFMTECAGGVWRRGPLDRKTMTFSYSIAATTASAADLLQSLIV